MLKLLSGAEQVSIFGQPVKVKAEVARLGFYSAHADRTELLRFLQSQDPGQVERFFLVHGTPRAMESFAQQLAAKGFMNVVMPKQQERFEL